MEYLDYRDETDVLVDFALTRHRKQQHDAANRLWRAIMLGPTIDVCEALLREEPVPRSALDPVWARRFGL
jgi:hypothetical protein